MIQKIIRVGHSAAVTLPKEFLKTSGFRVGQEIALDYNGELGVVVIKSKLQEKNRLLNPEFQDWLEEFTHKNRALLKKLANI